MPTRDDRLKEVLREYQEAGDVAVCVILRDSGEYSYAGPSIADEEVADLFQEAADAFAKKAAQKKVLN